ncbi:MAG: DUF4013 domain-containing protein [Deltaproteobacteria bacterium]|nr:DUF4013 domain-containing protein [Candidatus Zymogenaceae bacterium]
MDVKEIFMYPTKDKEWPVKMIIGIALSILPIVNFFCAGYAYRIFKAGLVREPLEMPQWDDWGDLFIQGLIIFVLRFLYFLIPLAVMGSGAVFLVIAFVLKDRTGYFPEGMILPGAVLIGVGLILAIVASVLFPMALATYAKSGERFGAAFRIWEIVPKIIQALDDYFIAIVLMICVFFAYFILSVIPYIGILFALLLSFYLKYLFYYGLFGSACAGAFEESAAAETQTGAK